MKFVQLPQLIANQAIIWLSPTSDKLSDGFRNCRGVCAYAHIWVFQLVKGQRAHKKSHLRKSRLCHGADRVFFLMFKMSLWFTLRRSLSIISNFI